MANLIDTTSRILSQNTICFETRNINQEQIPVTFEDANFGILNFTAVTSEETTDKIELLLIVDCSGSMSDMCSDRRTKMQHIIHTLKNMIIFFLEHPNAKINVTINAFDTQIYQIVPRTTITAENIDEIILKVSKIIPRGSTNIEFALRKSSEEINYLKTKFPENIIYHIFMTDGDATDGSKDIELLQSIVANHHDVTNAFVGFGIDHDATLLNGVSSSGKSNYYFIDKLESAGLVYGEILHGMVYKLLTDSEIIIENGLIYNFKTNTWDESLQIGDIISEANKTFNIISDDPEQCKVNIRGCNGDLHVLFPSTHIENADLSIHVYRQRTLQLLYEVNDYCNRKRINDNDNQDIFGHHHGIRNIFDEEMKNLKLKMANLMEEIKKYMTDNQLEDNKVLKNLCDDIYICFRTFGTKFGIMYCTARQNSQGTQRQYTVSSTIDDNNDLNNNLNRTIRRRGVPIIPVLQRQTNSIDFDDVQILNHNVSDFYDTPYLTLQATQVMREISGTINFEELEDDSSIYTQKIN